MPVTKKPLTAKQAAFAREYVLDSNATKAAIRAGFSERSAASQGHELLQKPHVRAEIDRLTAEKIARTEIKADEILSSLASIVRADMRDFIEWGSHVVEMDAEGKIIAPGSDATGTGISTEVPFVHAFESGSLSRHLTAAIAEVSMTDKGTFKIKLHDKLAALDKLMRHMGMFEKDNSPVADALAALIQGAQGTALTPAAAEVEDADE